MVRLVDDLLAMAKCGLNSTKVNIEINPRIEMKKFNFHNPAERGKSKCPHFTHWEENCPKLKVNGYEMESVKSDTYLGDIIFSDGKNKLNKESMASHRVMLTSFKKWTDYC